MLLFNEFFRLLPLNCALQSNFMKRILSLIFLMGCCTAVFAQTETDTAWKQEYRATATRLTDLVHTRLAVRFDYDKAYLYGQEWLTLQPHFYATDSVVLDAKGMEIKTVALANGTNRTPLKYQYDGEKLTVRLNKKYAGGEKYTLFFDYISKPNEVKVKGSAAITDAKGLYFINPKGEDSSKPTQIWTQGETEASSVWMITIDKPNQKTTQEISMTVPDKYVTLSNGLKVSEKKNADGTRTDTWKQDLPHAPYLFFMGVGDFAVIKDTPYKGKEVSYYVEKDQAPYAKAVFGHTPEMMKFFSEKLGVDYPWAKYSQMVGRDYVSGAMENTTATLHGEGAYQNFRQLADGNAWEETIAHELFHQWFGDLVTAESWSNLTVNESFANYSEYLWNEYKYGKDKADEHNADDMNGYLRSGSNDKHLVRYYYADKEDMFDAVSYNKGGRILHMLRSYVGDDAFFKSLNLYLTNNKFKSAEADNLRLAFEEVTGQDLQWFWNQWYFGAGQPKLNIAYHNNEPGYTTVVVKQEQAKPFTFPVKIDVYNHSGVDRYTAWVRNAVDSFTYRTEDANALVNFDADKTLLANKTDGLSPAQARTLYRRGKNYMDRREALTYFAAHNLPELELGLADPYAGLRQMTIEGMLNSKTAPTTAQLKTMEQIAATDKDSKTRAAALEFLATKGDGKYASLFARSINDSSYSVAGAALKGLAMANPGQARQMARSLKTSASGSLAGTVAALLLQDANPADFAFINQSYRSLQSGDDILGMTQPYAEYLARLTDNQQVKKGIDAILYYKKLFPPQYREMTEPIFNGAFNRIATSRGAEIDAYIKEKTKP